ncbi:hypothetical protein KGY14_03840 [Ameyamaea chiangmaiensis]|uniref:Uncharacterized protein n=1 Tax=Ameyamaea chiangmaiensis TaxID=442969 RepID=A0A850PED7_9PROT|nr:hypothetical protein [Ameyamaea chiangmaiensis]MBS4074322.1 hypothetical protein [Ameyamaea chiangmaiensis]NVN41049.1 hypothetical protein [Ameyamaea chiangmaiensis]
MKKLPLALALIALFGVVGWLGLHRLAQHRLDDAISRFQAALPPGESLAFTRAQPLLMGRGARLDGVVWHHGPLTLTAGRVTARGLAGIPPGPLRIALLTFDDVHVLSPRESASAADARFAGLTIPAHSAGRFTADDLAAATLDSGTARSLSVHDTALDATLAARLVEITAYGPDRESALGTDDLDVRMAGDRPRHASLSHGAASHVLLADSIRSITATGAAASSNHLALELRGLAVDDSGADARPLVRLERLHFAAYPAGGDTPRGLDASLHGLSVWPQAPGGASLLTTLGYDHLTQDITLHATAEDATDRLHVNTLDIDAPGAAKLSLAGDFDQVAPATPGSLAMALSTQPRIVRLAVTYRDLGLVDRALDALARSRGTDRATLLASLAPTDPANAPAAGSSPNPFATLAHFLTNPGDGALYVAVKPQSPVLPALLGLELAMAASPEVAGALGLTVEQRP